MVYSRIRESVERIKNELQSGNPYGEPVLLVAATKMQTVDAINCAIEAGVGAVAENKPQEFRDKNEGIIPAPRHFIGHLQTNKLKYIIGKVELIHSCDRDELAEAIAEASIKKQITTGVLLQVNIGEEDSKGGYSYDNAKQVFARLVTREGLKIKGFMAMLPNTDDEATLRALAKKMRNLFEWAKTQSSEVEYLSMGMSGDYKLCVQEGSNMIRLGSTIFGSRIYN